MLTIYVTGFVVYYYVEVFVYNEFVIKKSKRRDRRKAMLLSQLKLSCFTATFWPIMTVEALVQILISLREYHKKP